MAPGLCKGGTRMALAQLRFQPPETHDKEVIFPKENGVEAGARSQRSSMAPGSHQAVPPHLCHEDALHGHVVLEVLVHVQH